MKLHAPQIIYLILSLAGLFVSANRHGSPRTGKNNFFVDFISTCIGLALVYWGGFFS